MGGRRRLVPAMVPPLLKGRARRRWQRGELRHWLMGKQVFSLMMAANFAAQMNWHLSNELTINLRYLGIEGDAETKACFEAFGEDLRQPMSTAPTSAASSAERSIRPWTCSTASRQHLASMSQSSCGSRQPRNWSHSPYQQGANDPRSSLRQKRSLPRQHGNVVFRADS